MPLGLSRIVVLGRDNINYQEACELLEMMKRKDIREEPRDPTEWMNESIDTLLENTRLKELDEPSNTTLAPENFSSKPMFPRNKEDSDNDSIQTFSEDERHVELKVSAETYETGFRKWKEMTTRSPSGRHLGLYKALVHNPYFTEFFRHMCALPAQYGLHQKDGKTQ